MACLNISHYDTPKYDISPIKRKKVEINNIQETGYTYGTFAFPCKPINKSDKTIYKSTKDQNTTNISHQADTKYFSVSSPISQWKSLKSFSLLSSIESLPPITTTLSMSSVLLSTSNISEPGEDSLDLLKGEGTNNEMYHKRRLAILKCFQSTPIKILETKSGATVTPTKQLKDSHKHPLENLKKINLTVDQFQFQDVITELVSTFERKNNPSDKEDGVEYERLSSKILKNIASRKLHISYESELEIDSKVVGISSGGFVKEHIKRNYAGQKLRGGELKDIDTMTSNQFPTPATSRTGTDGVKVLLSSRSILEPIKQRMRKNKKPKINFTKSRHESTPSVYNINEILQEPKDMAVTPDLINEPFKYKYASYEDVTNLGMDIHSDEGKKQIRKHIFINESIVDQTEKMLKYGMRKMSRFFGSYVHLEGERLLLISRMRRQILINYLYRIPETMAETVAKVTIENLRCILNMSQESRTKTHQYYVCILQHKTTVYSTKIAAPNKLGSTNFGGFFIFHNVNNTFNIKIQLYSVKIPSRRQIRFALPYLKRSAKLPMMKLVGEAHIGLLNIKNKKFTFKNSKSIKSKEHKLTASIEASMNWPEILRGFLTVGIDGTDNLPVWNRRWCVLEDDKLKYYYYPSDETFCVPVGVIDFQNCANCDEAATKYLNQKTFRIFLDESTDFKSIFLSPDTNEDYEVWSKHFKLILKLIQGWKALTKK